MKDVLTLTEDNILAIPVDQPELLFTGEADIAKGEYRRLVSNWHPDQNPSINESVMAHINVLYNVASFRIATDEWVTPGHVVFKTVDGRRFQMKFRSTRSFELGDIYVGDNYIIYSLFKDNEDLYENAQKIIKNFKYANDKMRDEVKKLLPEIHTELVTVDRLVMVIKKSPDQVLLSDVLDHFNGVIDPKHVAWIVSRLYNIACYLKYSNLVHAGITLDSCLVSPSNHGIILTGGWWYAATIGSSLQALPGLAVEVSPSDVLDDQIADPKIDLELVLAAGRQLLGDVMGSKLIMNKSIPGTLVSWLRSPSKGDAFKEYETWQTKTLIDSFGPRRFLELKLTADDIYGKIK